ncbi:tRNA (guanine-N(7)-)-methyltransferase [Striga asiatica]|uniref:tRNA (Guanine-N(7)-)-methyltransferase n=1 Tax=Striga asiatica TaxID=4170 RepID=A0A5A7PIF5_STRAF|nr:tRNA (guanine-N(7)-)-methyltransferase [Striga asiatica]
MQRETIYKQSVSQSLTSEVKEITGHRNKSDGVQLAVAAACWTEFSRRTSCRRRSLSFSHSRRSPSSPRRRLKCASSIDRKCDVETERRSPAGLGVVGLLLRRRSYRRTELRGWLRLTGMYGCCR